VRKIIVQNCRRAKSARRCQELLQIARYFTSTQRNGDHARKAVLIAITMTGHITNVPSTSGLKVQILRCSTPRTTCRLNHLREMRRAILCGFEAAGVP
jgi:hypothetical protein